MKNELSRNNAYNDYDFFDEAVRSFFPDLYRRPEAHKYMRTDIKEREADYLMEVELPGMGKKDIRLDLKDGYLNISVQKKEEENDKKARYIRRERSISCSRSYYVGDVAREDIRARYENGILSVSIPKENRKREEESHIIIE